MVLLGLPKALSSLSSTSFCFSRVVSDGFLCASVVGRRIISLNRTLGWAFLKVSGRSFVSSLIGSISREWNRFVDRRGSVWVVFVTILLGVMVCHWVVAMGHVWAICFASFLLKVRSSWICCIMAHVSVAFLMRRAIRVLIVWGSVSVMFMIS